MIEKRRPVRYKEGHQPWDPVNGMRVGGFAGALLGAGAALLLGSAPVWLIFGGAAMGAAVGYFSQKRKLSP